MKKIKSLFTVISIFASLFLAGCTDPVIYLINNDVKSEEATVNGVVRSVARYSAGENEYLATVGSNGLLYKKVCKETQAHGTWTLIGADQLPFEIHAYDYTTATHHGQQVLKIVSDSNYLYAITVDYTNNLDEGTSCPDRFHIWAVQPATEADGSWKKLTTEDWTDILTDDITMKEDTYLPVYFYDDYYYTAFSVFFTNSPKKENRKVYMRIGGGEHDHKERAYYSISDKTISPLSIAKVEDSDSPAAEVNVNSAAVLGSDVLFFATEASATNETTDTAASVVYYGKDSVVMYKKAGETAYTAAADAKDTITCFAVCKDALIVGLGKVNSSNTAVTGGVEKVELDENSIPAAGLGTFTTNAKTQLLSYYIVTCLFNTDPSQNELDSSLYAGLTFIGSGTSTSVSYSNIGLWSYYPDRGNWNRE